MIFNVLFFKIPKIDILPYDYNEIKGNLNDGLVPDIIVTDFGILNQDEEKQILNFLNHKPVFIHTGAIEKKPFYSNLCFNTKWDANSIEWFGLKVLNDLLSLKAKPLAGFEEFINKIRENKFGFYSIKSGSKRVSFILKEGKILHLSHTENDLLLGNLLLNSKLDIKIDFEEMLKKQYEKGKFIGNLLIEKNLINENILKENLINQMEKASSRIAQMKEQEFYYFQMDVEIKLNLEIFLNLSHFLSIYLRYFSSMPSRKPLFLLKDTVLKAENFEEKKDILISPTQFYLLNEAKNPIEIKKLFYILPGEEKEKEKDITYLYSMSLLNIVKEGERLNPFEEVLKLSKEKDKMNFYEILGVKEDATQEDIRKAYFEAAKKYHPDKFSSYPEFFEYRLKLEDFFATINQAYQILSSKEERKKYDLELKGEVKKEFDPKERARELIAEAKKAISSKQYQIAIQKLSEIVYLKLEDWKVYQLLGKAYLEENKLKEAEKSLKNSLNLEEKDYETHNLLGDLYIKAGLKTRAVKEYQRALELNPANFEAKEKLNGLL